MLGALRYARQKGVTVVAAAGNQADGAVAYPARASSSVIAVGATTATGCEAEYSNAGADLDVVAPGGGDATPPTPTPLGRGCTAGPTSPGAPIYQQTFTRGVRRFGLPGRLRGHLDGEPPRDRDRGPADRHQAAGRAPEPGAGEGAPRAHRHRRSARPGSTTATATGS